MLNAYTLVFGGLLLLGGRAGDLFGRRRMFIIGVLLFALASLAGGLAQDKGWLLAMRALQGVGGAIASPTALALVTTTFPQGPERNRAFGVYAAVSGAGAAIGLILGGVLTDLLSWRWVFFVNAPIGIALAIAAPYVIAESPRAQDRRARRPRRADVDRRHGGVGLRLHPRGDRLGWGSATRSCRSSSPVVLLTAFVVIESRTANPIMPLRLFRSRIRVGSYVVMLVLGAAVFAMFYFLTQYVQQVLGYSPLKAGFAFLPVSAVIVVVAQIASRIVARLGAQTLIVSGTILTGFGLLLLSSLTVDSSYLLHVLPAIALIAMGMGFVFVPITLTAVGGVAPGRLRDRVGDAQRLPAGRRHDRPVGVGHGLQHRRAARRRGERRHLARHRAGAARVHPRCRPGVPRRGDLCPLRPGRGAGADPGQVGESPSAATEAPAG